MAFVKHILARITSKNIEHTAFKQRKEEAKRWMGVRFGPSSDGTISAPRAAVTGRGEEPSSRTGQGVRSLHL